MLAWFLCSAALGSLAGAVPVAPLDRQAESSVERVLLKGRPITAADGLWRSVVWLWFEDRSDCTGTLVAPRVVLTAAHCIKDPKTRRITAPAFAQFFDSTGARLTRVKAVDARFPAGYLSKEDPFYTELDVALVLLENPAPGTHQAAPLLPADEEFERDETLLAVGHGITGANKEQGMRKVSLTVVSREGPILHLRSEDDAGICDGDSGGPAFTTEGHGPGRLAAVASRSVVVGKCRVVEESDFVAVPDARVWLDPNLRAFEAAEQGPVPDPAADTYDLVYERARARRKRKAELQLPSLPEPATVRF